MTFENNKKIRQLILQELEKYFLLTSSSTDFNQKYHCIFSGAEHPFHNMVSYTNYDILIDAQGVREVMDKFKKYGASSFCWLVEDGAKSQHLQSLLALMGFSKSPGFSGMAAELGSPFVDLKLPEGFCMQEVTTLDQLKEWTYPFKIALDYSDQASEYVYAAYREIFFQKYFRHYVIYELDRPVASMSSIFNDQVAGIYNLAVLPRYQNNGLGLFLMKSFMNNAIESGFDLAVIQAAMVSEYLASKLGFHKFFNLIPYLYTF